MMDYQKLAEAAKDYKHACFADVYALLQKGYKRTSPKEEAALLMKVELCNELCDFIEMIKGKDEDRRERR